jgi:hypothetical protein
MNLRNPANPRHTVPPLDLYILASSTLHIVSSQVICAVCVRWVILTREKIILFVFTAVPPL